MTKLSDLYAFNRTLFEDGAWIDIGNGISVKLRSPQSAHSKAIRKKLEAPYAALTRGGRELPDDIAETLLIKQLSQSLIIDWKGIEDEDGLPLKATPENIETALRNFQFFRDDVGGVLANRETFRNLTVEADLKN
jgi:hypothetical protein